MSVIVEYTRYKIDEKRRTLFERVYEKAGEALASWIHCSRYELSHCSEDPGYYILRIEWDSQEGHLQGFRTSPEFKTFFALVQPYVNDMEEMRHYKVISAGEKSQSAARITSWQV
ncbi:MAG TPA: antibiotic biosynthesis monooxygenase family protein [Candidatus Acidoferrum sp.]